MTAWTPLWLRTLLPALLSPFAWRVHTRASEQTARKHTEEQRQQEGPNMPVRGLTVISEHVDCLIVTRGAGTESILPYMVDDEGVVPRLGC